MCGIFVLNPRSGSLRPLTYERMELKANSGKGIISPPQWYDTYFKLKISDQQQQQGTHFKTQAECPENIAAIDNLLPPKGVSKLRQD